MLKSCKYCNRIHDTKHDCGKKPQRKKQGNDKDKFRSTKVWQNKREEIRQRDKYLCQVCIRKLYDTHTQYTYDDLEVHHAIPLEQDFDKRLDNDNLITICERHHEMAERGEIPKDEILKIIAEQERIIYPPTL
ncbi:HNH endonuclease [Dehalobacter sp. DCM]|uniref:HNH endonuclease n=1 Tax=Dehalobacter sp. DCM TaxID=2907827 RepID=UPI003081F694|nr:HNH endonuclease [Dehalobacter sp. DCM]